MSLDVYLMEQQEVSIFEANITHNLNKVALHAGLYYPLWRPDEIGISVAKELIPFLKAGLILLTKYPEKFTEYLPQNGWGTLGNLIEVTNKYLDACMDHPNAKIRISR